MENRNGKGEMLLEYLQNEQLAQEIGLYNISNKNKFCKGVSDLSKFDSVSDN